MFRCGYLRRCWRGMRVQGSLRVHTELALDTVDASRQLGEKTPDCLEIILGRVHDGQGIICETAQACTLFFAGEVTTALPSRPSSLAIGLSASMQKAMCSSRSTPKSFAPLTMSSRFTLRAKALSFILFRTDFTSTSASDLLGLISATAVMNPASSSQAKSAFSIGVSRGTPLYSACDITAFVMTSGHPRSFRISFPLYGWSSRLGQRS